MTVYCRHCHRSISDHGTMVLEERYLLHICPTASGHTLVDAQ
ncbi:hypothetical protein [Natrarchaeobaculum aegyptiacum]|nr:hypothetical protein [Natrarchaeobaculum aegyptiacum]